MNTNFNPLLQQMQRTGLIAVLSAFVVSGPAFAANTALVSAGQPTVAGEAVSHAQTNKPGYTTSKNGKATYIVQLVQEPTAKYAGGIAGFKATSAKALNTKRLDTNSVSSKNYSRFLKQKQQDLVKSVEKSLGRKLAVKHQYQHAFNGLSMVLAEDEVSLVSKQTNVAAVTLERNEVLLTDVGPDLIKASAIWNGDNNKQSSKGEGIVVAILDTGINSDHPAFAAVGDDGYAHTNPLGSGNYLPGSYCDTNPTFCNDKLIGAWGLTDPADDPEAPEDTNGHGSHTAATVAGNVVNNAAIEAPTTSLVRNVTGVAPHANIIAYDVCSTGCPSAALLAAIEQVLKDSSALPNGIQALNYSISGGSKPYNDPIELGFLSATAAGIFVSASAGNSGPGPATVAHLSPWVATVAASTHTRSIDNSLVGMTSDSGPLTDLLGAGLTASYGPAPIVYAGNYANGDQSDPAQCLVPYPAGTFNGEIVICDRGSIGRTVKGDNVLAGGAGGFVLVNAPGNGDSTSADAHSLPAVHLGTTNGETLKAWVAASANPVASIGGVEVNNDMANADIMASFSSRGPGGAMDVLKPDMSAPGVSILAAGDSFSGNTAPEYEMKSGTSMSSPHNAGAGALISATTNWTPYEIKSALMMTAKSASQMLKEDGATAGDAFDAGAGRIQLDKVLQAGLVLNETPENFLAANPETGGDPRTLNIPSMKNSACVGSCSWTRTVRNVSGDDGEWDLSVSSNGNVKYSVQPDELELDEGESAQITVTADTRLGETNAWEFAQLNLIPDDDDEGLSNLHMPIAVKSQTTSNDAVFNQTLDKAIANKGEIVSYEVSIINGKLADTISLTNILPKGLKVVKGSLSETITKGTSDSAFSVTGHNVLNWQGTLEQGGIELAAAPGTSPGGGYLPMSLFFAPTAKPSNADDGALIINMPAFTFNGETIDSVIWSVNGTLELGAASGQAAGASNQTFPDAQAPNNILAPFWTDLDMSNTGEWYTGRLSGGGASFTIFEWANVPLFGSDLAYSFQVWIQEGTSNIWYTYGRVDEPLVNATVGAEDANGTDGVNHYVDGVGTPIAVGDELLVSQTIGGTATLTFQAEVKSCSDKKSVKASEATLVSGAVTHKAIAVTQCDAKK